MIPADVDIICSKCGKKAVFHTHLIGTYKLYPDPHGKVSCSFCGHNGIHHFTNKEYYYQIEIGDCVLFARTRENLISLKDYFENGYKLPSGDPDLDFPKEFYMRKEEIVKKIKAVLIKEIQ